MLIIKQQASLHVAFSIVIILAHLIWGDSRSISMLWFIFFIVSPETII